MFNEYEVEMGKGRLHMEKGRDSRKGRREQGQRRRRKRGSREGEMERGSERKGQTGGGRKEKERLTAL